MAAVDVTFSEAFEAIKLKFGLPSLREYQVKFFEIFAANPKQDFFIGQPTGNGKSLLFQGLPFFLSKLPPLEGGSSTRLATISLVIAPLTALIEDQISILKKKEIIARRLSEDLKLSELNDVHVLFVSPETILSDVGRKFLKKKEFNSRLSAVFVDESHCIEKWGTSDNPKKAAFRQCYSRLAEIRSFVARRLPFVAMTATATKSTREFIISNLQMITPELLIMAPGKSNITYYVKKTKHLDCDTLFAPLIKNLRDNGYKAERVIIFCDRSRLRDLYDSFENEFYNDYTYDERPFAMFHRTTRPEIKERIIKAFQDPDGMVRILIATIAFGMGIDCKNLHRIIHFGVPSDLDSYFQESGRAGRDGAQCSALLLLYPRCITRYVKKDIRDYVTNTQRCRREILLEVYDSKPSTIQPKHTCCDFCHQRCECENCESPDFLVDLLQSRDKIELPDNELINDEVEEQVECREGESESEPEIENNEH